MSLGRVLWWCVGEGVWRWEVAHVSELGVPVANLLYARLELLHTLSYKSKVSLELFDTDVEHRRVFRGSIHLFKDAYGLFKYHRSAEVLEQSQKEKEKETEKQRTIGRAIWKIRLGPRPQYMNKPSRETKNLVWFSRSFQSGSHSFIFGAGCGSISMNQPNQSKGERNENNENEKLTHCYSHSVPSGS